MLHPESNAMLRGLAPITTGEMPPKTFSPLTTWLLFPRRVARGPYLVVLVVVLHIADVGALFGHLDSG